MKTKKFFLVVMLLVSFINNMEAQVTPAQVKKHTAKLVTEASYKIRSKELVSVARHFIKTGEVNNSRYTITPPAGINGENLVTFVELDPSSTRNRDFILYVEGVAKHGRFLNPNNKKHWEITDTKTGEVYLVGCLNREQFRVDVVVEEKKQQLTTTTTTTSTTTHQRDDIIIEDEDEVVDEVEDEWEPASNAAPTQEEASDELTLSPCEKDLKERFPLEFPQMMRIKKYIDEHPLLKLKQKRNLFGQIRNGKARRAFYRCLGYTWWQINRAKIGWYAAGTAVGVAGGVVGYNKLHKEDTNGGGFGWTSE